MPSKSLPFLHWIAALRQKYYLSAWLILPIALFFCSHHAVAETNVNGDVIEILPDQAQHDATVDPVLGLIEDMDIDDPDSNADSQQEDLWARIKSGYAMPDIDSPYTAGFESWYAARPDYVQRMLARSQRYLFYIVEEVEKRGMPTEIALLPMIESAYNPQAYSRSHASGIWQFVPATGKHFGLKQNWWVDNRRSVIAATNAALDYLQKLYGFFGSWDLALAAYNAGEGTVGRAIARNKSAGLPTDYQSLNLPAETKSYVPKLQAIKNIINEPEKYGLNINSIPNEAYFAKVEAPKQIDAKLAAKLAEISLEEFNALNPGYNRPVIASKEGAHHLLLPVWSAERFKINLENYDKPLTSWQTYAAKRGERMDSIAKKFGMNVHQLRDVNGLSNSKRIRYARPVLVPAAYDTPPHLDVASLEQVTNSEKPATHQVQSGDTLLGIAKRYGLTAQKLMQFNGLSSSRIKIGQIIRLTIANISSKAASNHAGHASGRHFNTHSIMRLR